jgi:hypothetical protein
VASNGLYIVAPATADTTFGNVAVSIYGTHN